MTALAPIGIDAVEVRRVAVPLVAPFRTAVGAEVVREVTLVRALAGGDEGWGECAAMSRPTYSAEYAVAAAEVVERHLGPLLLGAGAVRPDDVVASLSPVRGHRMAKAALEMAVLDLALRRAGRSLAAHLGATRDRVECGVSVGIVDDEEVLLDEVARHLDEGYRRVKLKVRPGHDRRPVAAVRERFGDVPLQVDANGAYDPADVEALAWLDAFDLLLVEQPYADDDLLAHARLAAAVRTPVCLDESVVSAPTAAAAIALGACRVVNLKPGRVGGYVEARAVHDVCAAAGVAVWCGGMVETGLGRAANLALAALPGFVLPGDTSPASRLLARDIVEQPLAMAPDGTIAVPSAAGIGATVDPEAVRELTVWGPVEVARPATARDPSAAGPSPGRD